MTLPPGSRHGRGCFGQFVLVLLTLTFLSFYSLSLYFYMLAARALSLAPREDWTLINLSRAFRAQDGVWSGVDRFLSFFAFRLKDSVFLSLEKQCFVLTVLSEAIAIKAKKSSKTTLMRFGVCA